MQADPFFDARSSWPRWGEFLRRYGLDGFAAWALEAAGPLTALAAQALYFGGPLLRPALTETRCNALAGLLEDRDQMRAFAAFLREDPPLP